MDYEYATNDGRSVGESGMAKKDTRLICPECAEKVAWNGTQFVCPACSWTEYKEKPPSSRRIEVPTEVRDRKPKLKQPGEA